MEHNKQTKEDLIFSHVKWPLQYCPLQQYNEMNKWASGLMESQYSIYRVFKKPRFKRNR